MSRTTVVIKVFRHELEVATRGLLASASRALARPQFRQHRKVAHRRDCTNPTLMQNDVMNFSLPTNNNNNNNYDNNKMNF
ncbi:LysR family transcriptional regulator [Anopheles sinensis]|uniref:LysR family transcriptional regulator n=1 Tax=Anopheles sinensis TaxID=74873 RepID=A0A084VWP4_ANOSI|nr:LysR family transcriptional regulator [Anopheles sinensis]